MKSPPYIIWTAVFVHFFCAVLLCVSSHAGESTPMAVTVHLLGRWGAAAILFLASTGALWSITRKRRSLLSLVAAVPQQMILIATAGACATAIFTGKYADGTLCPASHIATDQLLHIFVAVFHTLAILSVYGVLEGMKSWMQALPPLSSQGDSVS